MKVYEMLQGEKKRRLYNGDSFEVTKQIYIPLRVRNSIHFTLDISKGLDGSYYFFDSKFLDDVSADDTQYIVGYLYLYKWMEEWVVIK